MRHIVPHDPRQFGRGVIEFAIADHVDLAAGDQRLALRSSPGLTVKISNVLIKHRNPRPLRLPFVRRTIATDGAIQNIKDRQWNDPVRHRLSGELAGRC